MYNDNGTILAGSMRALIKRLIPRRDYTPERSFVFTFLLNARIFLPPSELLHQILQVGRALALCGRAVRRGFVFQHCIYEQNSNGENFKKEQRTRFFLGILRLCNEWAENFPYDFRTEEMMSNEICFTIKEQLWDFQYQNYR